MPNTRRLLRFLILSSCLLRLSGQDADDVQKLVEKLYPKNQRLKEIRMGAIVKELGIREGGLVADVGCGPLPLRNWMSANLSVILSNVVGSNGKVYCEDISDDRQFGLGLARKNLKKQHVKNV